MALCVYHETVEAVATCVVCKQDICGKCREYGADGMCGMCLEMANARKAQAEANRQARIEAQANAPARPAAPGPRAAPAAAAAGRAPRPAPPPPKPAKPPAPPGMCQEHHDQKASALCAHCRKKVCPYCLDLYDLCPDCRVLDRCARHESMVAGEKCSACKLPFCRICLDNTDRCDRCRTLGKVGTGETKQARTAQLKGAAARGTTGKLPPPAGGPQAPQRPAPPRKSTVQVRKAAAPYKGPRQKGGPLPMIVGGIAVVALGAMFFGWAGSKPALSDEEAMRHLNEEMAYVQKAAIAIKEKRGAYPDSDTQIMAELKTQGVNVEKLPLKLNLVINAPASEPLQISYRLVGSGFEVRAIDAEGRPYAVNGRDVILRDQGEALREAPSAPPAEE